MTLHTLTQISGVKLSKASTILASFELAKRSLIDKEKSCLKVLVICLIMLEEILLMLDKRSF